MNPSNVVHDVFDDGEAAIIDLRSGTYFSLNASAALLWPCLVAGTTMEGLIEFALASSVEGEAAIVAESVRTFVGGLKQQGLIDASDTHDGRSTPPAEPSGDPRPFEAPTFERFDDLQDLLLLDPIHDVTDAGWPNVATK